MVCVSNCLSTVKYLQKATPIFFLEMGLTDAHAACTYGLKESPIRFKASEDQ